MRGAQIALIFQEPMTALNPVFRIGHQIAETLLVHGRATRREAMARAVELLRTVRITNPEARVSRLPAPAVRRYMRQRVLIAMALVVPALARHRRRADDGARRDDSGGNPRSVAGDEVGARPVAAAHHARSRRHRRDCRSRGRDVRRTNRRDRPGAGDLRRIPATLTRGACSGRCRALIRDSGFARSKERCRRSTICRPDARSTRAVPIASSRARPPPPSPDYAPRGPQSHREVLIATTTKLESARQSRPEIRPWRPQCRSLRSRTWSRRSRATAGLFAAGARRRAVVDDVSFSIDQGETFGLVGESGSGKTTTGRCMLRLIEPSSGEVRFRGENVLRLSTSKRRLRHGATMQIRVSGSATRRSTCGCARSSHRRGAADHPPPGAKPSVQGAWPSSTEPWSRRARTGRILIDTRASSAAAGVSVSGSPAHSR